MQVFVHFGIYSLESKGCARDAQGMLLPLTLHENSCGFDTTSKT